MVEQAFGNSVERPAMPRLAVDTESLRRVGSMKEGALSKVLRFSVLAVAALSFLVLSVSAQAATYVVGSPLALEFKSTVSTSGFFSTIANTTLGEEGAHVTSPVTGTIMRWRTKGSFGGGAVRLRVLRPSIGGQYIGAGASSFQTPIGTSLQTFPTDLPIQAGDLIGLDPENEVATYGADTGGKSGWTLWSPSFPEGSSSPAVGNNSQEIGFDAEVVPSPTLILVGPSTGPLAGGTTVTIAGRDFEGATVVKFGPNAASANFTVVSENEIAAVSPPAAEPGTVDITVMTPGGTSLSVPGGKFTYTAPPANAQPTPVPPIVVASCTVPNLIGKKLKKAKVGLRRAKCKLGKVREVKGVTVATGHVVKQSPKPGKKVAPGTEVTVKLG